MKTLRTYAVLPAAAAIMGGVGTACGPCTDGPLTTTEGCKPDIVFVVKVDSMGDGYLPSDVQGLKVFLRDRVIRNYESYSGQLIDLSKEENFQYELGYLYCLGTAEYVIVSENKAINDTIRFKANRVITKSGKCNEKITDSVLFIVVNNKRFSVPPNNLFVLKRK